MTDLPVEPEWDGAALDDALLDHEAEPLRPTHCRCGLRFPCPVRLLAEGLGAWHSYALALAERGDGLERRYNALRSWADGAKIDLAAAEGRVSPLEAVVEAARRSVGATNMAEQLAANDALRASLSALDGSQP